MAWGPRRRRHSRSCRQQLSSWSSGVGRQSRQPRRLSCLRCSQQRGRQLRRRSILRLSLFLPPGSAWGLHSWSLFSRSQLGWMPPLPRCPCGAAASPLHPRLASGAAAWAWRRCHSRHSSRRQRAPRCESACRAAWLSWQLPSRQLSSRSRSSRHMRHHQLWSSPRRSQQSPPPQRLPPHQSRLPPELRCSQRPAG